MFALPAFRALLFVSFLCLGTEGSSVKTASDKGQNVCVYEKTKAEFVLRRNVTSIKVINTKNCGVPSQPDLQCEEVRYNTRVQWRPVRRVIHYKAYNCCPGWRGYQHGVGCNEQIPCEVKISQKASPHCKTKRATALGKTKELYKLGSIGGLPFVISDMDAMKLVNLHLQDPFTQTWMRLYIYMLKKNLKLIHTFPQSHKKEFTTYQEYENIYHFFVKQMKTPIQYTKFFRFPFDTMPFKSVVNNHTWREDRVFSEMRLAGLNPMCIQRVTSERDSKGIRWSALNSRLNPNFHWERTVQRAIGRQLPLQMIVNDGSVFVCQFPLFDNMMTVPDIMEPRSYRKMWKAMSPIALFVSKPGMNGKPAELVPVAIQLDSKSDSIVYTPEDGDLWTLAKESFQVTDYAYVQMVEHLLKTHLMMEPFCVTIQRHLSYLHPLHQILNYHCRGLLPTNKIGFPKLVDDKAYMHQLFAIGNAGAIQLLIRAFGTMTWGDTDFRTNIKGRGLDDRNTVPFFPYRDDGELLYSSIEQFVSDYVTHYYADDSDVGNDRELQALANEMSAAGKGEDGGKGKLRGFPARITTADMLKDIMTRLIWTASCQHAAVNYPIAAYGAFTPSMPTKIYDDNRFSRDEFNLLRLPNGNTSAVQAGVAMSLGSLHLDDLFDYGAHLKDKQGGAIVQKHYRRLNNVIKPLLDDRNNRRFQEGHLTYPFFTPGWVPNSICT